MTRVKEWKRGLAPLALLAVGRRVNDFCHAAGGAMNAAWLNLVPVTLFFQGVSLVGALKAAGTSGICLRAGGCRQVALLYRPNGVS